MIAFTSTVYTKNLRGALERSVQLDRPHLKLEAWTQKVCACCSLRFVVPEQTSKEGYMYYIADIWP